MLRWLIILTISTSCAITAPSEAANTTSGVEFHLSGVLISTKTRSALVNGSVARAGEKVDGVEILSIDENGVRILSGSTEYSVPVGSTARVVPSTARRAIPEVVGFKVAPSVRRVGNGDTLSEIAEDYAGDGVSLNQVMVALFDANPEAFDGNINRLRAGAELRIPRGMEMRRYSPESALAEILQHIEIWRSGRPRPHSLALASTPVETEETIAEAAHEPGSYGPVSHGETLSEIAVHVSGDGVSMHQMMSALFDENPHAFGGSMDLLHEGAVLRVPAFDGFDPSATLAVSGY